MQLSFKVMLLGVLAQNSFALPGSDKVVDKKCKVDLVLLAFANPAVKAKASSFCSTFIGKTVTSTATSVEVRTTSVTKTLPTITNTVVIDGTTTLAQETSLTTFATTFLETLTSETTILLPDVTTTQTITVEKHQPTVYVKRHANLPPFAANFLSTQISSACSCLVTPPTSTVTVSATSTSISTAVFTESPTVDVTNSVIQTIVPEPTTLVISILTTATDFETLTLTKTPSTLIIPTTVTTLLPAPTAPAKCIARGGFYATYRETFLYTDDTGTVTPRQCYEMCQDNAACQSFFYPANGLGGCTLSSAAWQPYVQENPSYFYAFNNRNCPGVA